jgi:hypothetical protein
MRMSRIARVLLIFISLLLLVPIVGMPLQSKTALEQFHNGTLPDLPPAASLTADPRAYFAAAQQWLNYRVYPIIDAATLLKKILLFGFDTPPQRRVTLTADGFVFLNGTDDGHLNNIFETVCVRAQSPDVVSAFQAAIPRLAAFATANHIAIDLVVVPTLETLYGDYLPASVPLKYRTACKRRALGDNPALSVTAPAPIHLTFPFSQMHTARDDPGFYPRGNWHPDGLSMKVVRDTYLSQLGTVGKIDEVVSRTTGPSELLRAYGISKYLPLYTIVDTHVADDVTANASLQDAGRSLFQGPGYDTHAYRNDHPVQQETVLMLSDSFGALAAPVFAGAFSSLMQVTTNSLGKGNVVALINNIARRNPIDRIILLVEEGNTDLIAEYADDFAKAGTFDKRP